MSTYPGDTPEPPDGERPDSADTEPTQPVGYWERQAAERASEEAQARPYPTTPYPEGSAHQESQSQSQSQSGAVFNPTSPQDPRPVPTPGQAPYGAQPAYPPPGQAGPHPYAAAPGGFPGQLPYTAYSPQVPDHPQSTLALILGLVGLVGAFVLCGVTLVVSPFAWAVGHSAVKEIEASQGRLGGLSNARAGMIMGIIGTVLLVLAVLAAIVFVVLVVAAETTGTGSSV